MSGYLLRSKGNKKQGKRLWFVIKNKVLYTYAASEVRLIFRLLCGLSSITGHHQMVASLGPIRGLLYIDVLHPHNVLACLRCHQDVAALESQPLLGFFLREERAEPSQKLQFKLYHKNTLYYIFKADDPHTAQRYTAPPSASLSKKSIQSIFTVIFTTIRGGQSYPQEGRCACRILG